MPAGIGQRGFAALDQVATVSQLGQRVVKRRVLQRLFSLTQAFIGGGQFSGTQFNRALQVGGIGLSQRQARGFFAVGLENRVSLFLLKNLDAIGQGEGEQDRFGRHRQWEQIGSGFSRLHHAGGAQHQNHKAQQYASVAQQVEQRRGKTLFPADDRAE